MRTALAVPLAFALSCADMPTAPRALVTVSGQILDRDGGAVASVRIYLTSGDSLPGFGTSPYGSYVYATTDESGRFSLEVPAAEYTLYLEPRYDSGYPPVEIPGVRVRPGASTIQYRYQGVRISGLITGPDGSPSGTAVASSQPANGNGYAVSSTTGGRYSLLVPAGRYDLAYGPLYYSGNVGIPRITIHPGPIASDTTIDVALTGSKIDLAIRLNGTLPFTGLVVTATALDLNARATTDLGGGVTLYLPDGAYAIGFDRSSSGVVPPDPFLITVQGDEALPVDVPTVHWSGTLRRVSDGGPIENAYLEVRQVGPYPLGQASIQAGALGQFDFYVRPGRPYDVFTYLGSPFFAQFFNPARGVSSAADTTFDLYVDVPTP